MSPQFVSCSARARPASRALSPLLYPPSTVSPGPRADMNPARKSVKRKNVLTAISLVSTVLTNTAEGSCTYSQVLTLPSSLETSNMF